MRTTFKKICLQDRCNYSYSKFVLKNEFNESWDIWTPNYIFHEETLIRVIKSEFLQKDDERFTIYNLLRQKNRIRNFSQLRKKLREKMKFSSTEEINFDVCVNIRG